MKQSLVTRKNRKLRKLRQLYPEVRVKLFYDRDIERLARHRLRLRRCQLNSVPARNCVRANSRAPGGSS